MGLAAGQGSCGLGQMMPPASASACADLLSVRVRIFCQCRCGSSVGAGAGLLFGAGADLLSVPVRISCSVPVRFSCRCRCESSVTAGAVFCRCGCGSSVGAGADLLSRWVHRLRLGRQLVRVVVLAYPEKGAERSIGRQRTWVRQRLSGGPVLADALRRRDAHGTGRLLDQPSSRPASFMATPSEPSTLIWPSV
jgi:hypothetical protein